jgi:uncharacterized membrane protein YoaK (UPF0700 family)
MLVVLLAATAGFADALGYLGLGHVFTANMTGNTILLGLSLGQGQSLAVLRSLTALAGFILGVLLGTRVVKRATHPAVWPAPVTAALALECGLLLLFTIWGAIAASSASSGAKFALIAVLATALGTQSAAVHALRVSGVASTAATGVWVSLMGGLSAWLFLPHAGGGAATAPPAPRGSGCPPRSLGSILPPPRPQDWSGAAGYGPRRLCPRGWWRW